MKKFPVIFMVFSLLTSTNILSQGWLWSEQIDGQANIRAEGICADTNKAVYLLSEFYGQINIAGQNFTSMGSKDILITKYSKNGQLQWVRQAGDVQLDDPKCFAIDNAGNTYVTGSFQLNAYFDSNSILDSKTLTASNDKDAFLAKYDINGNLVWTINIAGGTDMQKGIALALHTNGDISVIGKFKNQIVFNGQTFTANGFSDAFYARFDFKGTLINAVQFKSTSNVISLNDVHVDNTDNVYITGLFSDTLFVGNDTLVSNGNRDVAVIKLNSTGNVIWTKSFGSITDDRSYGSVLDVNNNLYITGYFCKTMTIDADTLISSGSYDIFIAKIDANGNTVWAARNGDIYNDFAITIKIHNNKLLVGGSFAGTLDFGGNTITSSSGTNHDVFLGYFDINTGASLSAFSIVSSPTQSIDKLIDIAIDKDNNIFIAGIYNSDQINFGPFTLTNASVGAYNTFLSKYGCFDELNFTNTPVTCVDGSGIPLAFDGTASVTPVGGPGAFSYIWSNGQTTQNITGLDIGTYSVTVSDVYGCSMTGSTTVGNLPYISSSITSFTDVTCHGYADGQAVVTAVDGNPPYAYSWSNGAATDTASNLSGGIYYVTVSDQCGNISVNNVTIYEPDTLNVTLTGQYYTFFNLCLAHVFANVTGGTPPYTYQWSSGQTTADVWLWADQNYSLTVTDANGCQFSGWFFLPPCAKSTSNQENILASRNRIDIDMSFATDNIFEKSGKIPAGAENIVKDIEKLLFKIYPVPASDILNIGFNLPQQANVSIDLYDALGQKIQSLCKGLYLNETVEFDVSGLPAGMYFVHIKSNNNLFVRKIIISSR